MSTPDGLAAGYLAALLANFDRSLTPREIVQAFFKNPGFPLVPSTDEVRRAIFDLVNDGWELVDADGNPLDVASPGQIPINSINQTLRPRAPELAPPPMPTALVERSTTPDQPGTGCGGGGVNTLPVEPSSSTAPEPTPGRPKVYKRYIVEVANRSVTSSETREQVWQLFRELAKVIDPANPANPDHQLINFQLTLTTLEGNQGGLEDKATQIGARVRVEDDDF